MDLATTFLTGSTMYSFGIGTIIGYTFKKLLKLLMVIAGLYVASLYYLAQKGVIVLNTDKLQSMMTQLGKEAYSLIYNTGFAIANAGGLTAGFIVGWKLA